MGIVVLARPDRAHELVCYQHILCTANQQFTTSAVLNYDRVFRQHTASMALRWDVINQTLWSIHLLRPPRPSCTKCTLQNSRDRCPHAAAQHAQPFPSVAGSTRQVCFNFNRGRPCSRTPCDRLYACSSCEDKGHAATSCTSTTRFRWQRPADSHKKTSKPTEKK